MRDTMARVNLPTPEFAQKDASHALVRVTLRNDIKHRRVWIDSDAGRIVGEDKSKGLSQDEHRAINFAAEHHSINVSQLQKLTGRSWPYNKRLLARFAALEILKHVHDDAKDRDPQAHFVLSNEPRVNGANGAGPPESG